MTGLFLRPEALLLVVAAPVVGFLLWRWDSRRRDDVAKVVGPRAARLVAHGTGARPFLAAAAVLLAALALAQPVWGEGAQRAAPAGADVVLCLDVSRSMLAADEPPSRLARAREEIAALARHAEGDRLGLVVFAGEARLLVPLTRDLASLTDLLAGADPTSVRRGGTDLGAALSAAYRALPPGSSGPRTVVLLTDGEDLTGEGFRAAEDLRARGVVVHCVAFGSPAGAKIAVDGANAFLRGPSGGDVVTAADLTGLRRIAAATGGDFAESRAGSSVLVGLHDRRIAPEARRIRDDAERRERTQRFQLPLLGAFAAWTLLFARPGRRGR